MVNTNKESMKNIKYYIFGLLSIGLLYSCAKKDEFDLLKEEQLVHAVFSAVIEDDDSSTKTVLDDAVVDDVRALLWEPGDQIGVAVYNREFRQIQNVLDSPSANGVFEGYVEDSDMYYAIYPYKNISHSTNITVTIPVHQTYRENSFDRNMAPMVGRGDKGTVIKFQNLCGVFAVQLKGTQKVTSITFIANDGEKVAGDCSVNMNYNKFPLIQTTEASVSSVTLDCGEGVQLNETDPTVFYLVLAPGVYNGFSLRVLTDDVQGMEMSTEKQLTISRSKVTKATPLDFVNNADPIDLSERGTANSYIVCSPDAYSIDASIIGNGVSGILDGAGFHTSDPTIQPSSVELLWEDCDGLITGCEYDSENERINFRVTSNEGNALIAVKDADGHIIWSWHIWVTDQPVGHTYLTNEGKTFVVMDRYLGSTSAIVGDAGGALYYQWGRKDPFRYNGTNVVVSSFPTPFADLSAAIAAPMDYPIGDDWVTDLSPSLWSKDVKTIYDPCPVGWRVPGQEVWHGIRKLQDLDANGYGVVFGFYDSDSFWYPDTPRFDSSGNRDGDYTCDRTELWTAEYGVSYFMNFSNNYSQSRARSDAYPIRCMKDE